VTPSAFVKDSSPGSVFGPFAGLLSGRSEPFCFPERARVRTQVKTCGLTQPRWTTSTSVLARGCEGLGGVVDRMAHLRGKKLVRPPRYRPHHVSADRSLVANRDWSPSLATMPQRSHSPSSARFRCSQIARDCLPSERCKDRRQNLEQAVRLELRDPADACSLGGRSERDQAFDSDSGRACARGEMA